MAEIIFILQWDGDAWKSLLQYVEKILIPKAFAKEWPIISKQTVSAIISSNSYKFL